MIFIAITFIAVENLNSFYSKNVSIQKHIQTGKRINKPIDCGKLANLNLERLSNYRTKQNLQIQFHFCSHSKES